MVKQGHFHAHIKLVSRTKGYSAVAAAAYQSGQSLTHEQQRLFTVDLGYNKDQGGVTSDHRKRLNKGIITDSLRQEFAAGGITLGADAVATKDSRTNWTITDGQVTYTVKEFRHRVLNPETKKREDAALMLDVYADRVHTYTTREDVTETWLQAPAYAPEWIQALEQKGAAVERKDREVLWNWAEAAEVARDARTARTFQVALSRELSYDQNKALLRQYVEEQITPFGYIADTAIHSKKASDGKENLHAHILITARPLMENGELSKTKAAPWDMPERVSDRHKAWGSQLKAWRGAWADKLNDALAEQDSNTRVDHRSYKEQGVDVIPSEHVGAAEWNKGKRGEHTEAAARNEAIEQQNTRKDRFYKDIKERLQSRRPKVAAEQEASVQGEETPAEPRIRVRHWLNWLGAPVPRQDSSQHEQRPAPKDRTFGAMIRSEGSGGAPVEATEQFQRMVKVAREKATAMREHFGVYAKNWRERAGGQRSQSDRSDRER